MSLEIEAFRAVTKELPALAHGSDDSQGKIVLIVKHPPPNPIGLDLPPLNLNGVHLGTVGGKLEEEQPHGLPPRNASLNRMARMV